MLATFVTCTPHPRNASTTTPEQATVYAAIVAAIGTTLTLIVTIIGWRATHNSQKELLELQLKANQQRES
jgi:hypothetical protein